MSRRRVALRSSPSRRRTAVVPVTAGALLGALALGGLAAEASAGAAAVVAPPAVAAPPAAGAAAAEAAAIERLDDRLEHLVARLERAMDEHHVPGAALAIVAGGEPVLVRGLGVRDLATGDPVTADTVFAIGSATKSMTGLLAAAEAEAGGVALDASVAEVLPEFRFADPETAAAITLADLLAHTSGVMRTDLLWYGGYANWQDITDAFARAEPVAELGEAFHYQNVCYLAAGRILGEQSKRGWDGLLRDRILRPLGMDETGVDVEQLRGPRAATGYDRGELGEHAARDVEGRPILPWIEPEDLVLDDSGDAYWRRRAPRDLSSIAPAGAVNSTAADMARWVDLVLRRGVTPDGTRLIPESAFEEAWTSRIDAGPGVGYGLGFMIREWRGRRLVEHGGNIDGFSAQVAWLPDDGVGYALLANLSTTPMVALANDAIFSALLEPLPGAGDGDAPAESAESAESLERFVGEYDASLLFGRPVTVLVRDGRLAMDVPGQMVFTLSPPDEAGMRTFEGFPAIKVRFVEADRPARGEDAEGDGEDEGVPSDAGETADAGPPPIRSVELHQGGLVFEWLKDGMSYPIEVPLEGLTPLVGRYRAEEMPRAFRVLVRQNRLALEVPGETTYFLRPPPAGEAGEADEADEGNASDAAGDGPDATGGDEGGAGGDAEWWTLRETDRLSIRFVRDGEDGPATAIVLRGPDGELELAREGGADAAPLPGVDAVELSVQAALGRDAWEARLGLRLRGRVRLANQGMEGACTLDLAGYDRLRDRLDLGLFGWMETGMFGRRAWFDASFQPFQELPDDAAPAVGQLHPALIMADWDRIFDEAAVVGRRDEDGRTLVLVQAERAGQRPTTIAIDESTYRPVRLETSVLVPNAGVIPRTITFADWRDVEGALVPMRIVTEDLGLGRVERVYDEVELDPPFGPEIFRKNDPSG